MLSRQQRALTTKKGVSNFLQNSIALVHRRKMFVLEVGSGDCPSQRPELTPTSRQIGVLFVKIAERGQSHSKIL